MSLRITRVICLQVLVHLCLQAGLFDTAVLANTSGGKDKYLYIIYYADSGCGPTASGINGFADGDVKLLIPGNSSQGSCSMEASCLNDCESDMCRGLYRESSQKFTAVATIRDDGSVLECDETNGVLDQKTCNVVGGCYGSSVYPSCHFQYRTQSDILRDPTVLQNNNTADDEGMDGISLLMFYSDDQCEDMEGAHPVVAGNQTRLPTVDKSMSCEDAIACVYEPDGSNCADSGGTTGFMKFHTEASTNSDMPVVCEESGSMVSETDGAVECAPVDPTACLKSPAIDSCYYRHITAKSFFSTPEKYIKNSKFAATLTEAPTAAPSSASDPLPVHMHGALTTLTIATVFISTIAGLLSEA
eukprot:CAMPEP_0198134420 /NCGR_PEP_ID=MMETSP1442-20131203/60069_1 /TAXON_ID= /ORGANISM="Craspedostauros australis, Strain CCMP3328" /LENGTH=358 /DNA_ID=CAMNT_0043795563 /DNA_START=441 /DNA_END=1517 /DNA_ORIENTATION=-